MQSCEWTLPVFLQLCSQASTVCEWINSSCFIHSMPNNNAGKYPTPSLTRWWISVSNGHYMHARHGEGNDLFVRHPPVTINQSPLVTRVGQASGGGGDWFGTVATMAMTFSQPTNHWASECAQRGQCTSQWPCGTSLPLTQHACLTTIGHNSDHWLIIIIQMVSIINVIPK